MMIRFLVVAVAVSLGAVAFAPVSAQDTVVAKGRFEGRSGHETSGGVTIKQTPDGAVVVLEEDFSLDGAPDPKLGFGKSGYDHSSQFSVLRSNTGRQEYKLPATIDPGRYTEFYVWCERFSVPLGVAKIGP